MGRGAGREWIGPPMPGRGARPAERREAAGGLGSRRAADRRGDGAGPRVGRGPGVHRRRMPRPSRRRVASGVVISHGGEILSVRIDAADAGPRGPGSSAAAGTSQDLAPIVARDSSGPPPCRAMGGGRPVHRLDAAAGLAARRCGRSGRRPTGRSWAAGCSWWATRSAWGTRSARGMSRGSTGRWSWARGSSAG